jgi:uncharacterized protein
MSRSLTQPERFIVFALNIATFYFVYVWASGHWELTDNPESLWFDGAVAWWALSLLSAPFFRPPKDALASGVAALLVLATTHLENTKTSSALLDGARYFGIGYALFVIAASYIAALAEKHQRSVVARISYVAAERLSNGAFLFGLLALISIFGFYQLGEKTFVLTVVWLGFAVVRPFELLASLLNDWRAQRRVGASDAVGQILRVDDPNIVRVEIEQADGWVDGLYVACLAGKIQRYVIPLFSQIQDDVIVGTGLITEQPPSEALPHVLGLVFAAGDATLKPSLIGKMCGADDDSQIVGFVVEGSHIAEIRFEVSVQSGLEEGSVVFCCSDAKRVFYQVMDAQTAEESFQQNPHGTQIVSAAQLGTWDDEKGFLKFPWLPRMNRPVFKGPKDAASQPTLKAGEFILGNVPGTDMQVKGYLPDLIGYHAAILGITGTGKTELVLDLVREALKQKTKVFCVDLTGEYRARLAEEKPETIGFSAAEGSDLEEKLFAVETGSYGAPNEKKALKAFIDALKSEAQKGIASFLGKPGGGLGLFELAEVTNTKASLRATELYLSEIMVWARNHRKARKILIVLEEAHTIIPETAGAGFDYDTQWVVSRIGQIALQGRKYGVGLLIVSQRTALVSKTILSQCNTFLTHALIDQTSLNFLSNIYQSQYINVIPDLRFLQFLAYGKGVRSERPLLLERPYDEDKAKASGSLDKHVDVDKEISDGPEPEPPPPPRPNPSVTTL